MDEKLHHPVQGLACAWGGPVIQAELRRLPEDFQVCELPLLEPEGRGEHLWLWVRKRGANTEHVAVQLAQHAGVPARAVGYAGLKDRHAVTEQWYSIHLPGKVDPDWTRLDCTEFTVLRQARHTRKLQRGALRGNAFRITLRDVQGDRVRLQQVLDSIRSGGVPNYFGEQRFGVRGSNLVTATRLFRQPRMKISRSRRSLALSAARSLVFNAVLTQRVADGSWNGYLPGDAMQLAGSHSFFVADAGDPALESRLAAQDIHPTGPLYGAGDSPVLDTSRKLEETILAEYEAFRAGLAAAGLRQERRALRMVVTDLTWHWSQEDTLVLTFRLPAGGYATSVLRELAGSGPNGHIPLSGCDD